MMEEWYLLLKSGHIISMVAWMAGLFYLPRIFVYHAEKAKVGTPQSEIFKIMEYKLFNYIILPSMISTWLFGFLMCFVPGLIDFQIEYWFYLKFLLVCLLTVFTYWCFVRCTDFKRDKNEKNGRHYRIMNEVPTLIFIGIVLLVVLKPF